MTSYESVINTADEKLIRAEVRELALAFGLVFGFRHEKEKALALYPDNPGRIKQYTELPIISPASKSFGYKVPSMVTETLKHYFNYHTDGGLTVFYDTKKFTHYRNRQSYGREHKVRLDRRTMQYFWTAIPFGIIFPYAYDKENCCLDLGNFYCITNALDVMQNMEAVSKYLNDINVKHYEIEKGSSKIKLVDSCKAEQLYKAIENHLRRKLLAGKYITEDFNG